jgi:putative ABC transport system permease protein
MSNAFFASGDARTTLSMLAQRDDAVLVSEETVNDFQLAAGDTINLRLQGADHVYRSIPFTLAGVVREFPTAPHDSFLVANASYIAKTTGIDAAELVLARTNSDLAAIKAELARRIGGRAQIATLGDAVNQIASSLTAVDLSGISTIELVFGVLLAVGATALVLALGFADRRRDFAILNGLGAEAPVLGAFVWGEVATVLLIGTVAGGVAGWATAQMLVTVLQGVFDPPPEWLSVPWVYVIGAIAVVGLATLLTGRNAVRQAMKSPTTRLREEQ